jgi:hypothetical protein
LSRLLSQFQVVSDTTAEFNRELTALEGELKRLETEYNMYFAGRLKRPPWETRARVEATVKRLDRTHVNNYGVRFRFTTLQTRLSRFLDLWDRALRAREEGRPGPLSHPRKTVEPPPPDPLEDRIVKVETFHDPNKEDAKVKALYDSFVKARQAAGQERVAYEKFASLVNTQVKALKNKGGTDVAFRVAIKDGKVALTARALRATDE